MDETYAGAEARETGSSQEMPLLNAVFTRTFSSVRRIHYNDLQSFTVVRCKKKILNRGHYKFTKLTFQVCNA